MSPRIDLRPDRLRWFSRLLPFCLRTIGYRYKHRVVGRDRDLYSTLKPAQPRLGLEVAVLALLLFGSNLWAQKPVPIQNWPANSVYDDSGYSQDQSTADGPPQYSQQPLYPEQPGDGPQDDQQQAYADPDQTYFQPGSQQAQALNPEQLEQIVAPIALYPDNLLAQVLAASTYPAQVVAADQWRRMQGNAPDQQIVAGADAQTSWDPSVKALTAFPQVLAEMARNLQWTTDLGNAYYNQPQDVMQTVQVLRDRAQAAGNLQSTPQQQVTVDQGNIELAPPDLEVVYVPQYDPWSVYGQPVSPYPGFSLLGAVGALPIQYGFGIALQAFAGAPWGWLGWGLDWFSHSVMFNHDSYCSRSTQVSDWGFAHGGPRAFKGGWERSGYRGGAGWGHGNYPRPRPGFDRGFNRQAGALGSPGRFGNGRIAEGYQRGHQYSSDSFGRSAQQAYGRMPRAIGQPQQNGGRSQQFFGGRPQPYGGSEAYGRQGSGYGGERHGYGSGQGIARANPIYRSPDSGFRGNAGNSYRSYGGNHGSSGSQNVPSSGFHWFGRSQNSQGFSGSSRGFGGSSNFGGGGHSSRSFGGFGGGGGYKAPKTSHFGGGGGGHFSGGGHFGGGSHSGGSHSGGGGHSGGHHR